jgi:hypothetical protein
VAGLTSSAMKRMTELASRLVIVGLVASLTACSVGVTSTATSPTPTPTDQILASLVDCTRIESPALLVDDWSLVEHPRGHTDRERMLDRKGMLDHFRIDVRDWLNGLGPECPGVVELAQLNGEAARLAGLVGTDSTTDADYARIRASGDAWLDAVGYTDHRFGDDILAAN